MAISVPDAAYDAYFGYFSACTRQDLVSDSSTPTTLTNSLSNVAMASGDFSVDTGTPSGRRMTIAAKNTQDVTAPGTTAHAVLSLDGTIRLVTTTNAKVLATDDKVNFGTWYVQLNAPA